MEIELMFFSCGLVYEGDEKNDKPQPMYNAHEDA